ncbi:hypothetical protein [Burkholderia orbicola]|uniref:hypothetical protein n=1 Tax=Burkholderia orbicola TaxID=2978683 RepID=UPI002FE405B1
MKMQTAHVVVALATLVTAVATVMTVSTMRAPIGAAAAVLGGQTSTIPVMDGGALAAAEKQLVNRRRQLVALEQELDALKKMDAGPDKQRKIAALALAFDQIESPGAEPAGPDVAPARPMGSGGRDESLITDGRLRVMRDGRLVRCGPQGHAFQISIRSIEISEPLWQDGRSVACWPDLFVDKRLGSSRFPIQ